MLMEGGYTERYGIEIEYDYNGLYSKFIDKIYFRGKSEHVITEFGISIKKKFIKYNKYVRYNSLNEHYNPKCVKFLNMDNIIRKLLLQNNTPYEISYITKEDIILCEREAKIVALQEKIKKEKSLRYKIRKLFKI